MRSRLETSARVVVATHVNPDGDGAGSEIALAHFLADRGVEVAVVNPSPFPEAFEFLLEGMPAWTADDEEGRRALRDADTIVVLDTSEPSRLGGLRPYLERTRVAVVDHHPVSPESVGDLVARDPGACATGELVWDLIRLKGEEPGPVAAKGLYVAIVTDTGSFRFGNTTARAHEIVGELIRRGVDVGSMFRHLFARYTRKGLTLLQRVLASLEVSDDRRLAWLTLRRVDVEETGAAPEDREGLVEYARRIRGVEVALLFSELPGGRTKVSLRSNGEVDVAQVAQAYGGGGHRQAAGILMERPLEEGRADVLERARAAVEG